MSFDLRKNMTARDEKREREIEDFFQPDTSEPEEPLEEPRRPLIAEHSQDVLLHWQGPEYENYPKDQRWYMIASLVLATIIAYAIITNSPIMAITFILIGVVGYIYLNKMPRVLDFAITHDGILVGNEIYDYDDMDSFWIFYEPPHHQVISLNMKGKLVPYVHIPLHQLDPVKVRAALLTFIPEVKQHPTLVDTIERLLHI